MNEPTTSIEYRTPEATAPSSPAPVFDPARYRPMLSDLTEEKDEDAEALLHTLWNIMRTFVELGWGVDSVQRFLPELKQDFSQSGGDLVQCEDRTNPNESTHAPHAGKDSWST